MENFISNLMVIFLLLFISPNVLSQSDTMPARVGSAGGEGLKLFNKQMSEYKDLPQKVELNLVTNPLIKNVEIKPSIETKIVTKKPFELLISTEEIKSFFIRADILFSEVSKWAKLETNEILPTKPLEVLNARPRIIEDFHYNVEQNVEPKENVISENKEVYYKVLLFAVIITTLSLVWFILVRFKMS